MASALLPTGVCLITYRPPDCWLHSAAALVFVPPGSIGPIWRAIIQRAFDRGALGDLTADDLARLLKGISAHSTRVGLNQDLFVAGEDLAGIMDALRWKSPRMPLAYNRNLAAEAGAVGRLARKLE